MRRDDWLLGQLPMGMLEDDFFARFVGIFQEVSTTFLDDVDNLDNIVDVTVAPEGVVRWLGSWLGVESIDSSLPHEWGPKARRRKRSFDVELSCVAFREPLHSPECVGRSSPLRYCRPIRVGAQYAEESLQTSPQKKHERPKPVAP